MAKKKSKKGLIFFILILLVVSGYAIWKFVLQEQDTSIPVRVQDVTLNTITQKVNAIGNIKPETEVKISSETSGEIIKLPVQEGDTVKVGDLLAEINPDIIQTQLDQFNAALEASKTDIDFNKAAVQRNKNELERVQELYKKDFISKQDLERAKAAYDQAVSQYQSSLARYEQAKANLKQIQRNADRTTITAPIDGIVTLLNVEEGEKVLGTVQNIGTEMMRISNLNVMNAIVQVDENDIVLISIGDTARIEIDAFPDKIFNGIVKEIGHSAQVTASGSQDQVTNFEVKVRLTDNDPRLRPGMSCNVDIETETRRDIIAVPLQSVTVRSKLVSDVGGRRGVRKVENKNSKKERKPQSVVFVVEDETALIKDVETGISDEGLIEIKAGIEEGEKIVVGSFAAISKQLQDSSKVRIEGNPGGGQRGRGK